LALRATRLPFRQRKEGEPASGSASLFLSIIYEIFLDSGFDKNGDYRWF
jgi:hypothetical protein